MKVRKTYRIEVEIDVELERDDKTGGRSHEIITRMEADITDLVGWDVTIDLPKQSTIHESCCSIFIRIDNPTVSLEQVTRKEDI